MVKYSTGFSLIEILCVLALMLVGFFFAIPGCQQWLALQDCKGTMTELENYLSANRLQAQVHQQDILIDTDKIIISHARMFFHWHSKQALLFHANPLKNHVNGFFEIQCPNNKPFKLWVNRLGHTRVEQ